jgi:hypothetical protein
MLKQNAPISLTPITTKDSVLLQTTVPQIFTLILSPKVAILVAQTLLTLEIVTQLHALHYAHKFRNSTLKMVTVSIRALVPDSRTSRTKENARESAAGLPSPFTVTETLGNVSFQPTVQPTFTLTTLLSNA